MNNVISLLDKLEKGGKPAQVGEIRTYSGVQYQKMGNGEWKPVKHPEEKQLEAMDAKKEKTPRQTLEEKLTDKKLITQAEQHLQDLENGAVLKDTKTRDGQPVFTNLDAALAHGYGPEQFREVGNLFYTRAQQLSAGIERMKQSGTKIEPTFEKIVKINERLGKQFLSQANRIDDRRAKAAADDKAAQAKRAAGVKKSVTSMGHLDSAEIDTAKFSVENTESTLLDQLRSVMDGYQYGEVPRMVVLPKGDLHLVKVEDGLYSGVFKKLDATPDGVLEDNAKIRIERMTLPSLAQLCFAKEWAQKVVPLPPPPPMDPVKVEALTETLVNPVVAQPIESEMDKRLRMMELLVKLTT
jgi:hypothetical protein